MSANRCSLLLIFFIVVFEFDFSASGNNILFTEYGVYVISVDLVLRFFFNEANLYRIV